MYFNIEEMDIKEGSKRPSNNEYLIVDFGQPIERYAQKKDGLYG
ncbi:hypothetical protein [Bacillus toyonensis]|nr:hypothetical protein bcere0019_6550 [Bacillus cereus Rock3-28]